MKRAFIVIATLILATVPIFAAKHAFSVGIETGYPLSGITGTYGINNDTNITATFSYDYSKVLDFCVGVDYRVADFKIEKEKFNVHIGAQADPRIGFSDKKSVFTLATLGFVGLSYDFSIDSKKSDLDFTFYLKGGFGVGFNFDKGSEPADIAGLVSAGLLYHI